MLNYSFNNPNQLAKSYNNLSPNSLGRSNNSLEKSNQLKSYRSNEMLCQDIRMLREELRISVSQIRNELSKKLSEVENGSYLIEEINKYKRECHSRTEELSEQLEILTNKFRDFKNDITMNGVKVSYYDKPSKSNSDENGENGYDHLKGYVIQNELNSMKENIKNINSQSSEIQSHYRLNVKSKLENMEEQIELITKKNNQLMNMGYNTEEQIQKINDAIRETNDKISKIKINLEEKEKQSKSKKSSEKDSNYDKKINSLQSQINKMKDTISTTDSKDINQKITKLNKKVNNLSKDIQKFTINEDNLQDESKDGTTDVERTFNKLKSNTKIQRIENENDRIAGDMGKLVNLCNELSIEVNAQKEKLQHLEDEMILLSSQGSGGSKKSFDLSNVCTKTQYELLKNKFDDLNIKVQEYNFDQKANKEDQGKINQSLQDQISEIVKAFSVGEDINTSSKKSAFEKIRGSVIKLVYQETESVKSNQDIITYEIKQLKQKVNLMEHRCKENFNIIEDNFTQAEPAINKMNTQLEDVQDNMYGKEVADEIRKSVHSSSFISQAVIDKAKSQIHSRLQSAERNSRYSGLEESERKGFNRRTDSSQLIGESYMKNNAPFELPMEEENKSQNGPIQQLEIKAERKIGDDDEFE